MRAGTSVKRKKENCFPLVELEHFVNNISDQIIIRIFSSLLKTIDELCNIYKNIAQSSSP